MENEFTNKLKAFGQYLINNAEALEIEFDKKERSKIVPSVSNFLGRKYIEFILKNETSSSKQKITLSELRQLIKKVVKEERIDMLYNQNKQKGKYNIDDYKKHMKYGAEYTKFNFRPKRLFIGDYEVPQKILDFSAFKSALRSYFLSDGKYPDLFSDEIGDMLLQLRAFDEKNWKDNKIQGRYGDEIDLGMTFDECKVFPNLIYRALNSFFGKDGRYNISYDI